VVRSAGAWARSPERGERKMLEVDSESLRALSSSLIETADAVAALDPSPPVETGAAAMPNSAFGAAAAASAEPILAAYRATAERIRAMADAALASAHSYDEAEAAFRDQLIEYQGGL
jgi:hypothetical protein